MFVSRSCTERVVGAGRDIEEDDLTDIFIDGRRGMQELDHSDSEVRVGEKITQSYIFIFSQYFLLI